MFNISYTRKGGLRFLKLGRITITWSVTSKEAYAAIERRRIRHADETFVTHLCTAAIYGALEAEIIAGAKKQTAFYWSHYETCAD